MARLSDNTRGDDRRSVQDFSSLWPRSTRRLQAGIALCRMVAVAAVSASSAFLYASGLVTMPGLILMGGAAICAQGLQLLAVPYKKIAAEFADSLGHPPPHIRKIAADIFIKSGLSPRYKADIGIMCAPRGHPDNDNAGILPVAIGEKQDRFIIGLGRRLIGNLEHDQLVATIAHEAGHALHKSPNLHFVSGMTIKMAGIMMMGGIVTLNAPLYMLGISSLVTTLVCRQRALQLDEERADRASCFIMPEPEALQGALSYVSRHNHSHAPRRGRGKSLSAAFRDAVLFFVNTHPTPERRRAYIKRYVAEAVSFHEKHNIPRHPADYTAQFNLAAADCDPAARKCAVIPPPPRTRSAIERPDRKN